MFTSFKAGAPTSQQAHRWLWIPDRPHFVRLSGTTWVDSISNSQDTSPHPLAARCARVVQEPSPHKAEGAGNAGRPLRPQSRVQCVGSTRGSHHGHTGITRHSLRNGFNGFLRALLGDRACLPPSPADDSASLTPVSGRQDHTTSPSASAPFVFGATRVHRIPPP